MEYKVENPKQYMDFLTVNLVDHTMGLPFPTLCSYEDKLYMKICCGYTHTHDNGSAVYFICKTRITEKKQRQRSISRMVQSSQILSLFTEAGCVGLSWPHQGRTPAQSNPPLSLWIIEKGEQGRCSGLCNHQASCWRNNPVWKQELPELFFHWVNLYIQSQILKRRRKWLSRAFWMCLSSPHNLG